MVIQTTQVYLKDEVQEGQFNSSYTFPVSFSIPLAEIPLAKASHMPEAKAKERVLLLQSKSHGRGKERLTSWILIQRHSCYCWLSNLDRFLKKRRGIWNSTLLLAFILLPWVNLQHFFAWTLLSEAVWTMPSFLVRTGFLKSWSQKSFDCQCSKLIKLATTTTTQRDLLVNRLY